MIDVLYCAYCSSLASRLQHTVAVVRNVDDTKFHEKSQNTKYFTQSPR